MNTEKLLGDLWAKWDGTSIREHTDKLLENLNLLKSIYGDLINGVLGDLADDFWKALKLACEHHDYGKLHSWFQRKVGNPEFGYSKPSFPEVRHNLLSPAFLPDDIKEPLKTLIAMAIVHHHDYDPSDAVLDKVEEVLKEEFNKELSFTHRKVLKQGEKEILEKLERREGRDLKNFYILLKGFLLRIDHASSSKVSDKVESGRIKETEVRVREYLEKHRGSSLNDLQAFVLQNRDKNLLVRASTGYGKTEAGFIFLKDKGFFTLPIRTSANAIYERAKLM
ncbi:CRISPR-associated endonuclease Cas3'', partial [Hydrogenivirga sp.]